MSNYPETYLKKVIGIIKTKALKSAQVDWTKVSAEAGKMISEAKTTADTYASINYVLLKLDDGHSFLISRRGEILWPYPKNPISKALNRQKLDGLIVHKNHRFGLVLVPGLSSKNDESKAKTYAKDLQRSIAELDRQGVAGWIVDLRGNTGGNMWPMLSGLGPIIGAGTLGYFQYPKVAIPWFYEAGKTGVINRLGRCVNFQIENSISDCTPRPIAVLIDGSTASSGEAVAISLKGGKHTCFLGAPTRGLSTNNETIKLPDGATLQLTTSGECDRNNVLYEKGITPDIEIEQKDVSYGSPTDPALQAALLWLTDNCHI